MKYLREEGKHPNDRDLSSCRLSLGNPEQGHTFGLSRGYCLYLNMSCKTVNDINYIFVQVMDK